MEFKLPTELELPQEIQTTHALHKQGKLHHMLTIRVSLFAALTCVTGGVLFYDVITTRLTAELALIIALAGFLAGVYIFSRIQKARWDEKKEVIRSGRLDVLSVILIALYIGLRLVAQWYLEHTYRHDAHMISGITFALIFGLMLGRLTGVLVTIHKTHREKK